MPRRLVGGPRAAQEGELRLPVPRRGRTTTGIGGAVVLLLLAGCADKAEILAQCKMKAGDQEKIERSEFIVSCMQSNGYVGDWVNPNNRFCFGENSASLALEFDRCYRSNSLPHRAWRWAFGA